MPPRASGSEKTYLNTITTHQGARSEQKPIAPAPSFPRRRESSAPNSSFPRRRESRTPDSSFPRRRESSAPDPSFPRRRESSRHSNHVRTLDSRLRGNDALSHWPSMARAAGSPKKNVRAILGKLAGSGRGVCRLGVRLPAIPGGWPRRHAAGRACLQTPRGHGP
jgi:hypothetical protein